MKISTEELRQALKEVREEELNLLLKISKNSISIPSPRPQETAWPG